MYIYIHTYTHICIHLYTYTHTNKYMHTCYQVPVYGLSAFNIVSDSFACTAHAWCIHTHIHTHIWTCIHIYVHTHTHKYMHTCHQIPVAGFLASKIVGDVSWLPVSIRLACIEFAHAMKFPFRLSYIMHEDMHIRAASPVCNYVYMGFYACMYISVCMYACVFMYVRMHACTCCMPWMAAIYYIHTYIYTHVHMHVYNCSHVLLLCTKR